MLAKYSVSREEFVRDSFSGGLTKLQKKTGKEYKRSWKKRKQKKKAKVAKKAEHV